MSKSGGTDSRPGNPFKMITIALLIVAVVMALVFSTSQMEREAKDAERLAAAESEVAAVALFLEEGDLPNAVIALHDVGLRLGRVAGAEEAALAITEAVKERTRAHEGTLQYLESARREIDGLREQLAEADRRTDFGTEQNRGLVADRDLNALIVTNLAGGRTALARRLLDGVEEKDVVGVAAGKVLERIEALSAAGVASGAERAHRLRALARTWPVAGVEEFAALAGSQEDRRRGVREAIAAAEAALDRQDPRGAEAGLAEAVRVAGVPEVGELSARLAALGFREKAVAAETEGRLVEASAAWRAAGELAKATEIEARYHRTILTEQIAAHGEDFDNRKSHFAAAGCYEVASIIGGDEELRIKARQARARGWLQLTDAFRKRGWLDAALATAFSAMPLDPEASRPIADAVRQDLDRQKRQGQLGAAIQALEDGNAERAGELVGDEDAPDELRIRIEEGKRAQALSRARLALHSGEGKTALDQLLRIGHEGPLTAEARLLAGDVPKGISGLEGDAEEKTLLLLSTGWKVLSRDPARAARLGLGAVESTGSRPGAVALLTAALDKAGDPPKGDKLWDAVRAAIFSAVAGGGVDR